MNPGAAKWSWPCPLQDFHVSLEAYEERLKRLRRDFPFQPREEERYRDADIFTRVLIEVNRRKDYHNRGGQTSSRDDRVYFLDDLVHFQGDAETIRADIRHRRSEAGQSQGDMVPRRCCVV